MAKKKQTRQGDKATRGQGEVSPSPALPVSPSCGISARSQKAYDAAIVRENRIVAADKVTQDEIAAAGLAERSAAGDVYATDERSKEQD